MGDMAKVLLLIFITVYPGDWVFAREPGLEGTGGGGKEEVRFRGSKGCLVGTLRGAESTSEHCLLWSLPEASPARSPATPKGRLYHLFCSPFSSQSPFKKDTI